MQIKIYKIQEKFDWYQLEKFLIKHKKLKICDINFFKKNREEIETFWLPEIYDEYSSFGFIWDGKQRKKIKVTKDSKHKVMVQINVKNTYDN